ncbi:MAG: hypothetical protein QM535_20735 [Limnohabitans sp.]|nr:hypothetical protein [Limnohabitans sp.]
MSLNILFILILFSCKKQPTVENPKELEELKFEILSEIKDGSVVFYEIPMNEINDCSAILELSITINNDSITKSDKRLDNYIYTILNRVEKKLQNKYKCIDSLKIRATSYSKDKKYSFAIK